ncbi:CDP-diacylglycerol--glycerol-3-phosphate 3-phosphatidyltransferase [Oxobacter pfennigii]|uniref:CDP-diacylglycerol--serine O-phosphatidyltransferase n=1 Tax=Oxobacter pfennigii TaxID=36849 RepID=A0A0P8W9H7_9CLOT|nr:CDP-diacylglycerol--serine O-phosphatidyltransferase [Oxobacter pfennigii]KPU45295.1 CDP-diacylglycerol--glycerol-3-phosphate 3-phosphatidyltransferase [Oxobacter pfennigii]
MNKSSIPNIFTFINLSLGIVSIILTFKGNGVYAGFCILAAAFIDRYDGLIARKFNAISSIGKELDSLADLVSFGVAPSLLSWQLSLSSLGIISYVLLLIFPICGAYRLARFNISEFKNFYSGIPITVAGSLLAFDCVVTSYMGAHTGLSAIFILLLSYLMVSSIQIKKI